MSNPRVLAITLARGGSKGVPRKNILPILHVPLIAYTIAEAKRSKLITRYLVSTDDPEIQGVAIRYGAEAPFLRPVELSGDKVSSVGPLQHAVNWAEKDEGQRYDYIIELMCTCPMKTSGHIDGVIEKLISTGADSVIGVSRLEDHHPARIKKIVEDRLVDFCVPEVINSRRQDLKPDAYIRNGSLYAMRRDSLMVDGMRYGTADSRPYIMPEECLANVDSPIDFVVAEALLTKNPRPYVREMEIKK